MRSIVCFGGAFVDRKYRFLHAPRAGTSNPARGARTFGGVARNVAENLARLGASVALISRVGADENGQALLDAAARAGIDTSAVLRDPQTPTGEYVAMLDPQGDLTIAASDTHSLDAFPIAHLQHQRERIARADRLFVDCNVPAHALQECIELAREAGVPLAVDAVSEAKAMRLPPQLGGIDLLLLNLGEARAYLQRTCDAREAAAALVERGASRVALTLGPAGVIAAERDGLRELAAVPATPVDATGAGDALVAALLYNLLCDRPFAQSLREATLAAALTVESPQSVRDDLSPALLAAHRKRLEAVWSPR